MDYPTRIPALRKPAALSVLILPMWTLLACCLVQGQTFRGCPVFPTDNIWNLRIDSLPVHPNSSNYINRVGSTSAAHADFGSGLWAGAPIGIPFVAVPASQPKVAVQFQYAGESDSGPYPIPANPPIEGGGDRHILMLDQNNCILYELFAANQQQDLSWRAGSGAIFDLKSNALRPAGWTSADAAGLPIFPGLVRYEEVAAGEIRHAIRFTASQIQRATAWPARHVVNNVVDTTYPPMGTRFRLKSSVNLANFSPQTRVILRAMQQYGMVLADIGTSWYVTGAPDERWDNDQLSEFSRLHGSDFEAVDVSPFMSDPNSAKIVHPVAAGLSPIASAPASGSGSSQSFAFTFRDPAGWQDLGVVNLLLNDALDGRHGCYIAYNRPLNTLYLVNDTGDGLLQGLVLNGSGGVANSQCAISGSGSAASGTGVTLTLTLNLSFTSTFAGRKVIFAAARDLASNNSGWTALGSWLVPPGSATLPSVVSANPARGAGLSQSFTFVFADAPGWQNLDVVNVLINSALDGRGACFIAYSRPYGVLYLVDDAGTGLLPAIPLDGSASVENSQCRIHGVGSSVTGSGNNLSLTLNISFRLSLAGNRIIYAAARNLAQSSGWQQTATWSVE
ncbi:MAG: hypothetical protein ABI823_03140 [Bryobacteraceae bacterium]